MNFPARQLTGRGIISDIIIFYFAATPNGGFPTSGGECTQLHSSLSRRIKNPPTGGFTFEPVQILSEYDGSH